MAKVLGLDIGTSSIGWALIDSEQKKIIKTGVRIFPEGVNRDTKGSEISKNQLRREARQARKNKFRKKLRKKILIRELKRHEMYPLSEDALSQWISLNPYLLRGKALSERLSLLEVGRILYHLNQRRGFKSSRKTGGVTEEGNTEDGKIFQGDEKTGKIGIAETNKNIESGGETLGKYLSSLVPDNKPYKENIRIRNRYTTREMYVLEFNKIWDSQQKFYAQILTSEFRRKLGDDKEGILFFQRPLKSQKYLIGKCTFEKDKPRCPESAIPFELYRTYSFINTVQIWDSSGQEVVLTAPQRETIVDLFN
ncbi:MAG: hypothetical protein JNJ47_05885, partial [Alphaproteobacteria bacterium]|nr:hypothetical protein [Alphaproteobacteria bacterium]